MQSAKIDTHAHTQSKVHLCMLVNTTTTITIPITAFITTPQLHYYCVLLVFPLQLWLEITREDYYGIFYATSTRTPLLLPLTSSHTVML